MLKDDLGTYLDALQMEDGFCVDEVLKESSAETTQRVHLEQGDGSQRGPFIRKFISRDSGLGSVYAQLYLAQRDGRRFAHVPTVLECYMREDCLVVLMEYVDGETLGERVQRRGPSVELASEVFPALCDAVTELHEDFNPPIIHRDLKPANVMIEGNRLAIIDYGIARNPKDGADADTTHFGTRAFAPPEQFGFGQTDERSDVYALGMLLYFCLTGQVPDAAARERSFADGRIPDAMSWVIARAAALDPAARFQSVRELKAAFLSGCPEGSPADGAKAAAKRAGRVPPEPGNAAAADSSERFRTLGGFWNALLALVAAFFLFISIWAFFNPTGSSAQELTGVERAVGYLICFPIFTIATALFLSDKRPLKRTVPFFRNWRWSHWIIAYVAAALILFMSLAITRLLAG